MNRDDIIRMAKEDGMDITCDTLTSYTGFVEKFEKFAARVIANNSPQSSMAWQEGYAAGTSTEREACAKVCEQTNDGTPYNLTNECAAAIRARGTQ